jgi:hypothetical protein
MYQEYASHHAPNMCLIHIPIPQQDTKRMTITSSIYNQYVPQIACTIHPRCASSHTPQACVNIHKPCTKRYHQTCAISLIHNTTNPIPSIQDVPLIMYHTITRCTMHNHYHNIPQACTNTRVTSTMHQHHLELYLIQLLRTCM